METTKATMLEKYWRRRRTGYVMSQSNRRSKIRRARFGSAPSGGSKGRFFRLKRKVKFGAFFKTLSSPKRLLTWLRDAYVNMMLRLADSPAMAYGYYGNGAASFGARQMKEYDERMILELYRSLVASGKGAGGFEAHGPVVKSGAYYLGKQG